MNITFRASAYLFVLLLTACAAPVAPPPVATGPSAKADFSLNANDQATTLVFSERLLFDGANPAVRPEAADLVKKLAALIAERDFKKVELAFADDKNPIKPTAPDETHVLPLKLSLAAAGVDAKRISARLPQAGGTAPRPARRMEITLSDGKKEDSSRLADSSKKDADRQKLEAEFLKLSSLAIARIEAAPPPPPPQQQPDTSPVAPGPSPEELKRQQAAQKREATEEAQRLAPYQKNLFQVFKLSETLAGFKPKANVVGVYELAASRSPKLRLALAQLPSNPVKLSSGSYLVTLEFEIEYTEKQECTSGACAGKSEDIERSTSKSVQITLTPKNNYSATATLPMADPKVAVPRGVRSSYSNLVLTVRRMTAATVN